MESNYDDDAEMEFSAMPSFIPKDAPAVSPPQAKDDAAPKSPYEEALKRLVGEGKHSEKYGREVLDELIAEMRSGAVEDSKIEAKLVHYGFSTWESASELRTALRNETANSVKHEELPDGTRVDTWYSGGEIHREDGPAVVKTMPDGSIEEQWLQHGKLHREGGPAVTRPDGSQEHWINGDRRIELETVAPVAPEAQTIAEPTAAAAPAVESAAPAAKADAAPAGEVNPDVLKALLVAAQETAATHPQSAEQQAVRSPGVVLTQSAAPSQGAAPMVGGGGADAAQSGLRNLADGGLGLVGGLAALAGSVGRGVGGVARNLASDFEARRQAGVRPAGTGSRVAPGISVLPKITQYRVEQAEKMANAYESAMEKFWTSGKLPDVRRAIEEHARESGASVADVMAKMVPGGELEQLRTSFIEAVGDSPDAQESKKGMDRALDGWARQYGRGSEELLNPETAPGENDEYDRMRERFEGTREKMSELVTQSPVFAGEEKSHAERFREAVERIAKKIQEVLESVAEFIRGRNPAPQQREEPGYEP